MPEISRFLGIVIMMFDDDHNPPHIHVRYGGYRASITIEKGIVEGQLPRRVLSKVFEWMDLHHDELIENWVRLHDGRPANSIKPLNK